MNLLITITTNKVGMEKTKENIIAYGKKCKSRNGVTGIMASIIPLINGLLMIVNSHNLT